MRSLFLVTSLCCLLSAPSVQAADNTVNLGDLNIIHRSGLLENATFRAPWPRTDFASKVAVEIRNTEKVQIRVLDPNPLLFTYDFNGVTQADSENFKNVQQFAAALQKLGTALGTTEATSQGLSMSSLDSDSLRNIVALRNVSDSTVVDRVRAVSRKILDSITGTAALDIEARAAANRLLGLEEGELTQSDVRDLLTLLEYQSREDQRRNEIAEILNKYDFDTRFFRNLGNQIKQLSDIVASFEELAERSAGDDAAVRRVKQDVEEWNLPALSKDVNLAFEQIDDAEFDLVRVVGTQSIENVQQSNPALFAILLAKDQEEKVRKSLESADAFAQKVAKIDVPLTLGNVSYAAGKVSTAKFTIQPREEYASLALKSGRKTGTFEIEFAPRSPVLFGFGGALVYSFVEKPEFGTRTEDGKTTIIRKDDGDEYVAQNVAAILTLTPRGWFDPEFGAGFFIGVTPEDDELAFYLGAGIRAFSLVNVGLGWTYQEVPKLADGLRVGGEIAKPEDLKVGTEFKGGWFLSLNIKFR